VINLTYDLFGRPRTITHPKIEDRRTYAGASGNYRLTQIQTVAGTQTQTTRMQYDYAGYDALGRLTAINDTTPNKPSATDNGARYTYDALGLTNAQLPRLGNANFAGIGGTGRVCPNPGGRCPQAMKRGLHLPLTSRLSAPYTGGTGGEQGTAIG
jgi:hypothetical protein